MKNRNNRKFERWESAELNDRTYLQYYNRLTAMAISMFEWVNLPDSIDPRFLELTLFSDGYAVFFRDEVMGELALPAMIGGKWDVYRIPTERRAYATNGYQKRLTEKDSVLIYNNDLHTNSMLDVEMYARRLYELERTIDVNIRGQKTPVAILCSPEQRLTMKNLYMQYDGNEPFIFGSKDLDLSQVKSIETNTPYVADKIQSLKMQIWNEALACLGISSMNVDKKERMLADEVSANMGGIEIQKYTRLNARKQACEKINEMFGLDIDVRYRENISAQVGNQGGEEDGEVYDTSENGM